MLLISSKEVDQQAVGATTGMEIISLPAVGLRRGGALVFVRGLGQSYRAAARAFKAFRPRAVLAMGGFTSVAPILAARRLGALTFLHESNAVVGRANRWLSWVVDRAFVGFGAAAAQLHTRKVTVTGTPVRRLIRAQDAAAGRAALGLDPVRPTVLVMGGSQGASAINQLITHALPWFARRTPDLQWLHLTGGNDVEKARAAYAALNLRAIVHSFFRSMELALGAATAAIGRAGASSLAELAAARVPAVLIPYPAAVDNHQYYNARALEASGAARLLEQKSATPEALARLVMDLVQNSIVRQKMQRALAQCDAPQAAEKIVETMLDAMETGLFRARDGSGAGARSGGSAGARRAQEQSEPWDRSRLDICVPADCRSVAQRR